MKFKIHSVNEIYKATAHVLSLSLETNNMYTYGNNNDVN